MTYKRKNTIRDGGSTALYTDYTVDLVYTVDMVCTVDEVNILVIVDDEIKSQSIYE